MEIFAGLLLGVAIGLAQLFLSMRYLKAVTSGSFNAATAMAGVGVMIAPFAALVVVGFLWVDGLVWTGIGAGAGLSVGAVISFLSKRKGDKK